MSEDDEPLSLTVATVGREVVITVAGDIDPHTAVEFSEALVGFHGDDGISQVTLDLSEVRFMDSSGLRVVLAAERALSDRGAALVLQSPSDVVRRLLEITDLIDRLDVR